MYLGKIYLIEFLGGTNTINLMSSEDSLHQWTILLGNNNAGKTNILKAIADLEAVDLRSSKKKIDFIPLGLLKSSVNLNEKCIIGSIICNKQTKDTFNSINIYDFRWMYTPEVSPNGDYIGLKNLKIYAYGVTRRSGKQSNEEIQEEFKNSASLFFPNYILTDLEEWLHQLNYSSKIDENNKAQKRLKNIKELLIGELFPDILDIRFKTTEEFTNYVEFQTNEGWFRYQELGYGYQSTLSWIVDFAKKMFERYTKSPNPLKEPAIVLVDEIDLHLHPQWQKDIIKILSNIFTSTQFIVTTHSPHIVQALDQVNLCILKNENKQLSIVQSPTTSFKGWTIEEILEEVLLLEGNTTSEAYNKLMATFDKALDEEDYDLGKKTYDELDKILHPQSEERKLLKIQLSQIKGLE